MLHRLLVIAYAAPLWLSGALWIILDRMSPVDVGPGGILMIFVIIYLICASVLFTILHLGLDVLKRLSVRYPKLRDTIPSPLSLRRSYYTASVLAFGPVLLLALNTVRQLRLQDIVLVIIFLVLAVFYIAKRD